MIIKTKKVQLEKNTYIKIALTNFLKQKKHLYYALAPVAICLISVFYFSWWWIVLGVLTAVLYIAFWAIQFAGVTMMEQNKPLFEKLMYEIDSRQILMKINERQGMPVKWEMVKSANLDQDKVLLFIDKAQFIYLPIKAFNSDNDVNFLKHILKSKKLIEA
ncbi:MAG: hypothetical protein U0V72_12830 [Cytophagales bacterium]